MTENAGDARGRACEGCRCGADRDARGGSRQVVAGHLAGLRVATDDDGDPVLIRPDGTVVDTWREDYPCRHCLRPADCQREQRLLQIELIKLQNWIKAGQRLVALFEGRDAAGTGGAIRWAPRT